MLQIYFALKPNREVEAEGARIVVGYAVVHRAEVASVQNLVTQDAVLLVAIIDGLLPEEVVYV